MAGIPLSTCGSQTTQVGFGHGENVFGWRFYPRFQSPDTESNLKVLVRDNLIGGPNRNQLLRQRRLEPGARECVALVVMPSFVPYVTLDSESNWFGLANPKHKILDHTQAARLSKTVKTLEKCGPGVADGDCYRDGEVHRLQTRVQQLANRLPAQTLVTPVPVLNTLGGFEMFSNGTTDLSPVLYGWYGAPGVSADADTTIFLVGNHFSPIHTKVIVGNVAVTGPTLLSRQVMQVTVPKEALGVPDKTTQQTYVPAHVATPYGVTTELLIPIVSKKKDPKPGVTFGDSKLLARYGVVGAVSPTGAAQFLPAPKGATTDDLKLAWDLPGKALPPLVALHLEFDFLPPGAAKAVTLPVPSCGPPVLGCVSAKEIVFGQDARNQIANDLLAQIAALGPLPVGPNPLDAGLKSKAATITPPVHPGEVAQPVLTADALTVVFQAEGACPVAAPTSAPLPHPKEVPAGPATGAGRDPATIPLRRGFDDGPPPPEPGGRLVVPPVPADLPSRPAGRP